MSTRRDTHFEAIAEGTRRAFWQLFTNATSAPCGDFFFVVERAIETATENVLREAIARKKGDK